MTTKQKYRVSKQYENGEVSDELMDATVEHELVHELRWSNGFRSPLIPGQEDGQLYELKVYGGEVKE